MPIAILPYAETPFDFLVYLFQEAMGYNSGLHRIDAPILIKHRNKVSYKLKFCAWIVQHSLLKQGIEIWLYSNMKPNIIPFGWNKQKAT